MFNERLNKLAVVDVAPVWAVLKRLDAPGEYQFLINPNTLSINKTTAVSSMTPLGASLPNLLPQTQTTAFSLPLLLISPANNRDMSDDIALLETFSKLSTTQTLPKLSFTFGSFKIPLCCITAFSYSIAQWRAGKPVAVTGSLTIQPYAEVQKPELFKETVVKQPAIALSPREQTKVAEIMTTYENRYTDIKVDGEVVTGISRKTKKKETLFSIKNAVRI